MAIGQHSSRLWKQGDHRLFLDGAVKAALAEDLRLDNKAGWNYLKALPLSRRKRKQLMAGQWIVNLFAGPFPTTPEFKVLEDVCVGRSGHHPLEGL